jgi:two-component system sensor histidine kinase UhpB
VTEIALTSEGVVRRSWTWFGRQFRRISLFYRVLLANVAIITLGAVLLTFASNRLWREYSDETALTIITCLTVIGLGLSVLVNVLVLHAAFRPLSSMHRTALAVQSGDLAARAPINPSADPEMVRLATTFNATLDELEEDRQQLRLLANQVIRAQEEERRRVSRELHDDTAQVLFAQLLQISALKSADDPDVRRLAERFESSTVGAIEGVRRLALELRPPALDDLGLAAALGELVQRFEEQYACRVDLSLSGLGNRLPADVELVLYRIAQEALMNIGKHAHAGHARVGISREPEHVTLFVRDDGQGFDELRHEGRAGVGLGLGLFGMEERAVLIGGTLQIRSAPGQGTEIQAVVPLKDAILA